MLMLRRYCGVIGLQMMMKWVKVALGMDGGQANVFKRTTAVGHYNSPLVIHHALHLDLGPSVIAHKEKSKL